MLWYNQIDSIDNDESSILENPNDLDIANATAVGGDYSFRKSFEGLPASSRASHAQVLKRMKYGDEKGRSVAASAYALITDANYIWVEIAYHLHLHETPSYMTELSDAEVCEFHAPTWLEIELRRSVFTKMARQHRVSVSTIRAIYEEFVKPRLIFHDGYLPKTEWLGVPSADADDTPYVELCSALGGLGVVSKDKHIERLLARRIGKDGIEGLRMIARLENTALQAKIVGYCAAHLSANLSAAAGKSGVELWKKASPPVQWATIAALLGGAAWFAGTARGRKQAQSIYAKAHPALATGGGQLLDTINWISETEKLARKMRKSLETG